MLDRIAQLENDIKNQFPTAETELKDFSSGSAMLDIRFMDRLFVMAYSPESGFGVDEVLEGEGFDMGYRFLSDDFEPAAEELYRLLRS